MTTFLSRSRCLALAGALFPLAAAALEEVKVGGTGNALGTMRLLAAAFAPGNPDIKVTVLPSLGSGAPSRRLPQMRSTSG
jgi:phosphate transport system substrate-binding protein